MRRFTLTDLPSSLPGNDARLAATHVDPHAVWLCDAYKRFRDA